MDSNKRILGIFCKYSCFTIMLTAVVACGGGNGGETMGSRAESAQEAATTAQALAVPPTWVGRKPLSEGAKKIAELEASGALPKLDTSNTLSGPDLDRNGIRDDIDKQIEQQNLTPQVKASVQQQARAYQKILTTDFANPTAVEEAKNSGIRANKCLIDRFNAAYWGTGSEEAFRIKQKIKAFTLNTKARLMAWVEFDKRMNGQTFSNVPGNSCE